MPLRKVLMLVATLVVAIGIGAASTPAVAQESTGDRAYAECRSRVYDRAAAQQLLDDGVINGKDYGVDSQSSHRFSDEQIQEMKRKHLDEFKGLAEHYESNQSWSSKLGRTFNSFGCNLSKPGDTLVKSFQEFWDAPIGKFVQSVIEGNAQTLQAVMTFWMDYSTKQTANVDANVQGIKNIVHGLAALALVTSFIIGGARIAQSRRMGLQDGVEETASVVVKYIIFSTGVVITVPSAMVASDMMADEIMNQFGVSDPDQVVEMASLNDSMGGPIVILLLAIVSLCGAIMQFIAMVTRVLILPIAVGLTPLAAASSFSETGRNMLNSLVAFMIACVVYKPIAALLYAVVMWNATQPGEDDLISAAVNILMIALAGFTAPALIRVIAPMTAAAGGGGASSVMTGASAAGGAVLGGMATMASMGSRGAGTIAAKTGAIASGGGGGSTGGGAPLSAGGSSPLGGGGGRGGGGSSGGGGGGGSRSGGAPSVDATPAGARGGGAGVAASGSSGGRSSGGGSSTAAVAAGAGGAAASAAGSRGSGAGEGHPSSRQHSGLRTTRSSGGGASLGTFAGGVGRQAARASSVSARIAQAGLSGTAAAAKATARGVSGLGTAGANAQRILDDSVGVNGYGGTRNQ